jgi:hypothetical protein
MDLVTLADVRALLAVITLRCPHGLARICARRLGMVAMIAAAVIVVIYRGRTN